jgi:arylsulfatase A-like enzyme
MKPAAPRPEASRAQVDAAVGCSWRFGSDYSDEQVARRTTAVAALDAGCAALFSALGERAFSDAIVVVAADHGEEFGSTGCCSTASRSSADVRVPL